MKNSIISELTIDKASPEPYHLQLYNSLKQYIIRHRLNAGTALPSERQLSITFELNRNTVHRAYQSLKDEGILATKPQSRGLFISENAKEIYQPSFPCIGIVLTCSFSDFLSKGSKMGVKYLSGIVDRANELNFSTMIINLPHLSCSKQEIDKWREELIYRLSGIIYFGDRAVKGDYAFESLITYKQIPQIFASGYSLHKNVSTVSADVRTGGMAAAELLQENGHRKVGIIIPPLGVDRDWGFINMSHKRPQTMKECFESCGLKVAPEWIIDECCDLEVITQKMDKIFSSGEAPTAFWCQNDFTAIYALEYFKSRNIKIPEDISLIGFDDIEEGANSIPPLTSIRTGTYTIGKKSVELLAELFHNAAIGESRQILVPTSLSCRQSVSEAKSTLTEVQI